MEKRDIVSYNYDELQDEIKSIGEKPFRAKQIYAWLHEKLAEEFDEMTNLSKALREKLDQAYEIRKVKVVAHQISKVDPTEKFLFELEDGNRIESVLMNIIMAIRYVFPHRSVAGWGADSARLHWMGLREI